MKETKDTEHLHNITRFIIFLPLIIVIIFLFFNSRTRGDNYGAVSPTQILTQTPANNLLDTAGSIKPAATNGKLDLNGPTVCAFKDEKSNTTAYIKNKNIYAKQVSSKSSTEFILKGDCVYIWGKDSTSGQKICGVSQYLGLLEMFSSTPFFDLKTIVPALLGSKSGVEVPEKLPDLDKVCKKGEVDEKLFNVPSNVEFQVQSQ